MGEFSEVMQAVSRSLLKMPQKDYTARDSSSQKPEITKPGRKVDTSTKDIAGATGNEKAKMARTGGRISKTGRVKLHKGEMVSRKTARSKCRGGRR